MKSLGLLAAAAALAGCGIGEMLHDGPQIKGSGKLKSESRKVGRFVEISTNGAANCKVKIGSGPSVTVTADDNILPIVETRVDGKSLVIETKGNYATQNPVTVTITVPSLEAFSIRGSGDTEIQGVKGTSFRGEITGAGDLKATGQTDKLTLTIKGSGNMDFLGLKARNADASISGSGDIRLFAMGNLDAAIRGSGNISYAGKPAHVNKTVSGSGEIEAN